MTRTPKGTMVSGLVVKPLARAAKDRRVKLRIATGCSNGAAGRTVTVVPSSNGAFKSTSKLTADERAAPALYGEANVRKSARARARGSVRTFTLTRGVAK